MSSDANLWQDLQEAHPSCGVQCEESRNQPAHVFQASEKERGTIFEEHVAASRAIRVPCNNLGLGCRLQVGTNANNSQLSK